MQNHALITGGAGFIGSHLADLLIEKGYKVTVLDCLLPQVHGDSELDDDGWPVYLNPKALRIKGNILDEGVFQKSLEGVTHLVHLAASVGVGQSMTNIIDYTRNNAMVAAHMLEVLSRLPHSVRRMAVASSMSIYGEGEYVLESDGSRAQPQIRSHAQLKARQWEPTFDDMALVPVPTSEDKPLAPTSIYAINKRDHEEMFLVVGRAIGIPTTALRLFNVYGSRQALSNPYTGVAAIFISRFLNDKAPLVFEDGEQKRDFVHVRDVATAFASVLESNEEMWEIFNVGSGRAITVNEIARILARLLRKNITPQILNQYRVGDIRHCFADISKIQKAINFQPQQDFEEGMEELIEWVTSVRKPVDRSGSILAELTEQKLVI